MREREREGRKTNREMGMSVVVETWETNDEIINGRGEGEGDDGDEWMDTHTHTPNTPAERERHTHRHTETETEREPRATERRPEPVAAIGP